MHQRRVEFESHLRQRAEEEENEDAAPGWKKTMIFTLDRQVAVKRRSHYAG